MAKKNKIARRPQARTSTGPAPRRAASARPFRLLFTSAGRRVELLREFRRAAGDLKVELEIHAVDCQPTAPALCVADFAQVVPPIAQGYIDRLVDYCGQKSIDAVVPLIDPELQPLSNARRRLADVGTRLVISDASVIRVSQDKILTSQFLLQHGFRTPRILSNGELATARLPLFIKPRCGSASLGAFKIDTLEALHYYRRTYPDSVIEEFVEGQEYTVDVFCDFAGRPLCAVPRMRIEVRGGEVSKSLTVRHEGMIAESLRLAKALAGCMGMMTVQCFLSRADEVVFNEINPRFGGGVPLSIRAGADSPRWLLELLLGRTPSASMDGWVGQMFMLRYDSAFFCSSQELPG
jgi:carbamoyl-phosphate synthase large subunit